MTETALEGVNGREVEDVVVVWSPSSEQFLCCCERLIVIGFQLSIPTLFTFKMRNEGRKARTTSARSFCCSSSLTSCLLAEPQQQGPDPLHLSYGNVGVRDHGLFREQKFINTTQKGS
jgi:hypothetical protein